MDKMAEEARGETPPRNPGKALGPEQKPPFQPERRRLVRNLPSSTLFLKIRAAERRMEAGEREMGFYLLDLKRRHVYRDACVSIMVASGSRAQIVKLKLEPFVLVGATTEESLLPKPFHSRFGIRERLDFYSKSELEEIALGRGAALGVEITREAATILASGSRGTPRELHGLLRRARDLAQIERGSVDGAVLTGVIAERALGTQGIDPAGLSRVDRKLLGILVGRNRPVGLRSLADLIGETQKTVAETYEPYLFREGYIARTHRGRVATEKARQVFRSRMAAS
jgi:Holliday junction DNA helicase RuvB